jgi:hypothetical protein
MGEEIICQIKEMGVLVKQCYILGACNLGDNILIDP